MHQSMFKKASLRLTAVYLLIIMSISLIFSVGLYQLASNEIEQGIRRPNSFAQIIRRNNLDGLQDFLIGQDQAISEAKRDIKISLTFINLFILITGGLLSYYLARRSLVPIERAHESQSRFTSDASHELRTPIAAMRLENEIALTDPKLTVKQAKDQLESNIEELDKLTSLTVGLLQLARLENDPLTKAEFDLKQIIEDAIGRNKKDIAKKKQTVDLKLKSTKITTNYEALTGAIATLINNASKYSSENSDISVKVKDNKTSYLISVADKGIGIDQLEQEKIFDRFYRSDLSRTKNDVSGYGIGLSIAKKSIEALGGNITVTSTPTKGSTFSVLVPKA